MTRTELNRYIRETYHAEAEFLWKSAPSYAVYRHKENRKWFAVIMEVPKEKLGLSEEGSMEILNIKAEPAVLGAFLGEPGVFPGYHMHKGSWLSLALNGEVPEDTVKLLLQMSAGLTAPKPKKKLRGKSNCA